MAKKELERWSAWFGGREEYILEVGSADGDVVIRARPDAHIVTIFKVPWRVDVRRRTTDPFGPVLWSARAPDRDAGRALADDLYRRIRAGEVPWSTSP
jgi:hypothetical protein